MVEMIRFVLRLFGAKPDPAFEEAVQKLNQLPENTQPIDKAELIRRLRELARRRPSGKDDLIKLEAEAYVLGERISRSPIRNETPHNVWHFLSDADIRLKDPGYSDRQVDEILGLLQRWERDGA